MGWISFTSILFSFTFDTFLGGEKYAKIFTSRDPSSMLGVPHCSMKLNRTRFSYSTVLGGVCTLTYLPRLENRGLPLDPGSPGTTN